MAQEEYGRLLLDRNHSRHRWENQPAIGVRLEDLDDEEILRMTRGIYRSFLTPRFIMRKLTRIRSLEDVSYYIRLGIRVLGHLLDFRKIHR